MLHCFTIFILAIRFLHSSGMANVGRMALTNYILQTIICTFVFYGWGLGLFGQLTVISVLPVMLAVWLVLIIFSSWWLKKFKQGPLEWIWRKASLAAR